MAKNSILLKILTFKWKKVKPIKKKLKIWILQMSWYHKYTISTVNMEMVPFISKSINLADSESDNIAELRQYLVQQIPQIYNLSSPTTH